MFHLESNCFIWGAPSQSQREMSKWEIDLTSIHNAVVRQKFLVLKNFISETEDLEFRWVISLVWNQFFDWVEFRGEVSTSTSDIRGRQGKVQLFRSWKMRTHVDLLSSKKVSTSNGRKILLHFGYEQKNLWLDSVPTENPHWDWALRQENFRWYDGRWEWVCNEVDRNPDHTLSLEVRNPWRLRYYQPDRNLCWTCESLG